MIERCIDINKIKLNYLEYPASNKPILITLHGITANAHAFDGLLKHGLNDHFHIISPDLRGRGDSGKPAFGYSVEDHAKDIIGMLDYLGIEQANLCGHSYGGLLSAYLAAKYPNRVACLMLLDAAAELNPNAAKMLIPVFSRLGQPFASFDAFLNAMKAAPQNTFWEDIMETYYRADVNINKDGSVLTKSNLANISAVAMGVLSISWTSIFEQVKQPAILINAADNYTLGQPLLPALKAKETVIIMQDCQYVSVTGNHHTMVYGEGAIEIVTALSEFWAKEKHKIIREYSMV
jgi:pimeloyl-ACP methyl ester carboxylesterase